jgi:DNA topoisomerase IB
MGNTEGLSDANRPRNTRAVCRKCYIHPGVISAYRDGLLIKRFNRIRGIRTALVRFPIS